MRGVLSLEKLLNFSIILAKPFSVVSRGDTAYFLSSYLENCFQLLAQVLEICFAESQFLLFSSILALISKLNFPRQ